MKVQELVEARAIKEYKVKRLPNVLIGPASDDNYGKTQAQVVRTSDGAEMLDEPRQLSFAQRCAKDMNNKTRMGLYLINYHDEGFPSDMQ